MTEMDEPTSIFRAEAIAHQRRHLDDKSLVARTLPYRHVSLVLLLFIIFFAVALSFLQINRRETVEGYVWAASGIVTVRAPQDGVVTELKITEGQKVKRDDELALLSAPRVNAAGVPLDRVLLLLFNDRLREIDTRINITQENGIADQRRMEQQIEALDGQILRNCPMIGKIWYYRPARWRVIWCCA